MLKPAVFAVHVTHDAHVAEYFHFEDAITESDYELARQASGKIIADYWCGSSLVTTAGLVGSLESQDTCSVISFESERPAAWDIPMPASTDSVVEAEVSDCGYQGCPLPVPSPSEQHKCRRVR